MPRAGVQPASCCSSCALQAPATSRGRCHREWALYLFFSVKTISGQGLVRDSLVVAQPRLSQGRQEAV